MLWHVFVSAFLRVQMFYVYICLCNTQDDPTGVTPPASGEKKPKGRVKKEKPEKEKAEKADGLKQTKLTFKKEPKKVFS